VAKRKVRTAAVKRSGGRELFELIELALVVYLLVDLARPAGALGRSIDGVLLAVAGLGAWPLLAMWLILAILPLVGRPAPSGRRMTGLVVGLFWVPVALTAVAARRGGGAYGVWVWHHLTMAVGRLGALPLLFLWLALALYLAFAVSLARLLAGGAVHGARAAGRGGRALLDFVAPEVDDEDDAKASPRRERPARRERPSLVAALDEATATLGLGGAQEPGPDLGGGAPVADAAGGAIGAESADDLEQRIAAAMAMAPEEGVGAMPRRRGARASSQTALEVTPPPPARDDPSAPYRPAPVTLLERSPQRAVGRNEVHERRQRLEHTLASFGVEVHVLQAVQGPAVTRFELLPAPGVKVSRILSLQDDIALAMAAPRVRIEAPIPGKSAVGIEVPNLEVTAVRLRDILESSSYRSDPSPLAVALGKDVAGSAIVAALDRMPHLLIAGATGSGKSVCVNALLASLLCRASPAQVRLLLIDPKVVELRQYDGIAHLLAPVVTDPRQAAKTLAWVVAEMERRYRRFADAGAKDLVRYNALELDEPLPYYVVVIDELADLMMVAAPEVEDAIARLAQMARAAGIHLVVATQRPSVDVITGLIKANIPSRLAFAVSSQVDSRTILDTGGAEKLLGRGDMLFSPMGSSKPIRAQGALVTEGELEGVIAYVREQRKPDYAPGLLQTMRAAAEERDSGGPGGEDPLLAEAVRVVIEARGASTSLLQRRLRVGYSRAGRLMDALSDRGFVGPPEGPSKPREVRISAAEAHRLFGPKGDGQADGGEAGPGADGPEA
jgi:DNA segregation ATPase FtsK/SpoIIIE, S-DNA-T family